ncbi:SpoIIE family protein phosphatase [Leptolyngbya sp. FACHB-36]|uniref:SpoIIE family protein phosphatase n=1 Tax=Leptolyngbya sp. FACHB-36 TaxID=2692808 RepID=UPI00168064E2|nr:SpoIIE family protein phosphatase [Leptolyngbya sp. FACHB-36]MBD2020800.1 SpoIIE family protein phosphatase [Leptolyngbya sp. FACHB-36]
MAQETGSKLKLMVVDDEPDNLDLLYRTFRRNFEVIKANSAIDALQILGERGEMAIIISDQRMPEMLGTEFLSKTVDRFPDTIRIVLTGHTDVQDLVEAINSGKVFKYITKPWSHEQLQLVVQQAAETYQVLKQRTNDLRRALRRESLFNAVTTAIRESLDYHSMLQTIAATLGQTFEASRCVLYPVSGDCIVPTLFCYSDSSLESDLPDADDPLIQAALSTRQLQRAQFLSSARIVVPLTYQQEFLAVLVLDRVTSHKPWSFEDMDLLQGVAEQAALAISQATLYRRTQEQAEQMRAELAVARQIQSNLLRQQLPELDGMRVQACCCPAREVGGDFFEVYVHPQGDVWLAVGDVSGKGVPAALFMASAISVLRRELAQEAPEPHIVMQNLNRSLLDDLVSANCFITMILVRYSPLNQTIVYANAGHIYPLVWLHRSPETPTSAAAEPNYLTTRGIPLGILPHWKGSSGNLELHSGEVLLLTSDGITEATVAQEQQSTRRSMLQQTGLWKLLQEHIPLDLNHLLSQIRSHNTVQEDDQTILSLEVL